MRGKFIGYLILFLITLVIVIIVIVANSDLEPASDIQQPELSAYEQQRMNRQSGETVPEETSAGETEEDAVDFAEVDPQFPGGEEAMIRFIQREVRYPETALEMGEQGTVYVQFVVHTDGSVQHVKVLKGVSESLDREAVRVIKKMPHWEPGMQNGEPIRVRYQIPIKFSIAD